MGNIQSFTTMLNYSEMVRHSEWQKAQHEIWAEEIQKQILEGKNKSSGQRICSDPKSLGALMLMFITFLVAIALLMVLDGAKNNNKSILLHSARGDGAAGFMYMDSRDGPSHLDSSAAPQLLPELTKS